MESSTKSAVKSIPSPDAAARNGDEPTIFAGVLGVGIASPERILTNEELSKMVDTTDEWIRTRTGIRERHIAAEDEATSDLALAAARRALNSAGLAAEELDLVIVATATPDHNFPSTASIVQHGLHATHAAAFDLSAACSGFIYGLVTGAQFINTGLYQNVLVIGAETLSRITNWSDRSTCVLFGDGAGAVVLGRVAPGFGILSSDLGSDGGGADLLKVEAGGSRMPSTVETLAEHRHCISMNGNEVYKFAVRAIEDSARRAMERAGYSMADVDCLVAHQANSRILDAAARRLELPPEKVFSNVHRYGNTSAASIPLALGEAVAEGVIHPGDLLVLVGFGAGLTWASCVLRWGSGE